MYLLYSSEIFRFILMILLSVISLNKGCFGSIKDTLKSVYQPVSGEFVPGGIMPNYEK